MIDKITPLLANVSAFFRKPFFNNPRTILYLWIGVSILLGVIKSLTGGLHNNYKIYKYVYFNILEQFPMFERRPLYFDDLNHYGPIFGLIIAPFALLPDILGGTLWLIGLALLLFFAIKDLEIEQWQKMIIYWIATNSLIISQTNVQFNIATAALIIWSFTNIKKEKDMWAAFMIMLGVFVKLYGVVGFAFFFFSKHKPKLLLWSIIWGALFFVLPMAISSPSYIVDQYWGWYNELLIKNGGNNVSLQQNISFLGMVRKSTGHLEWSNLPMIIGGLSLFALTYLRINEYKQPRFQLLTLASVLIFTVLFSTGSEPNTYIIAIVGVAIWFVIQPRPLSIWNIFLIVFSIVITSFSPSDLFPRTIYKQFILPNSLQALPCTLVWLTIVYEMVFRKSDQYIVKKD
jgi:hypothetical protein